MQPEKIGLYEIKSILGYGGMATVYRGYDPRFGREVAIKVLPRELLHADPQFRLRFEREAKIIAQLEHSAIVPVYDVGEADGQPYFVMRYMKGGSLSERIKAGPSTIEEATRILGIIAPGLDEAHSAGIIHRDIKPSNILFDSRNNPYISDFGIAKSLQGHVGRVTGSAIIGTPAYMAPEQATGDPILDGRADIYALGIILYEMLTGHQPYESDSPMAVAIKHVTDPVPRILVTNPKLPQSIDAVIQKAMAKNRDERFKTAHDMVKMLNETLERKDREEMIKTMGLSLRVFVCHASQDKHIVRELYDRLKSESWIDPWLDKARILPGQLWEWVIEKAVEESDVVIVCLSNQSITKEGYVQKEIRYAYDLALEKPEGTIYLIPLRLDNCELPRKLRSLQWVDYFGDEKRNADELLLEALKLRLKQKIK